MRDQPVLHAGNVHVRKLQSLATVHGDQRHRVAGFVILIAFAVERNVLEKTVQPFRHRTIGRDKTGIHRVEQIDDVAHAVLGGFLVLLHSPNLAEQTHLIQPSGAPHLERVRRLNGDRAVQPLVDRLHQLNKVEDAVDRAPLKLAKRRLVAHHGKHGATALLAQAKQLLHRGVAEAASRDIRDTQQAGVIVGIEEQLEVRDEVADFAPVKKTLPADEVVADFGLAQRRLERAGLLVGAEQYRLLPPLHLFDAAIEVDLLHQRLCLLFIVAEFPKRDRLSGSLVGPKFFLAPLNVVFDDRVGGLEDRVGGAVVLLKLDHLHLRKMFLKVEQIGHLGTAPAVDALVVVAHDAKVSMLPGQAVYQLELRVVGVLIFVHHDVAVTLAAFVEGLRALCEQPQDEQNKVVKIDGVAGLECLLIGRNQALGQGGQVLILGDELIAVAVPPSTDQRQDGVWVWLFRAQRDLAQDAAHHAKLLGGVVDDEVFLVAQLRDVPTQNADAQRVKGADGRLLRLAILADQSPLGHQASHPLLHLTRGLVGESDGKDVPGPDAARDHVSHAAGNDPCFAGTSAGENEQRAINGAYSLTLLGVQRGKLHPATRLQEWIESIAELAKRLANRSSRA